MGLKSGYACKSKNSLANIVIRDYFKHLSKHFNTWKQFSCTVLYEGLYINKLLSSVTIYLQGNYSHPNIILYLKLRFSPSTE